MTHPLLNTTKTKIPSIPPKTLFCERIRQMAISGNRLSVLVAPAGFGKTTAVLLSLQDHRDETWWYRLEQEDAFLDIFFHHLIVLLFSDAPQIQEDQLRLLRSLKNLEEEYSILSAQICQDLTFLCGRTERPRFLVFDDFQWVSDSPAFSMILMYFVRNMPDNVHLVITSRKDPGILSGKLCMNYVCRQFTAQDLLFTPEEVRQLIDRVYDIRFTPAQYELITQRSQGWAAGIYILSQSIENQRACGNEAQMLSEVDSMFSLFFLEYLLGIDQVNKNRLMDLAMLDEFSIDELNDLFHYEDAEAFLHRLAMNQLCFQAATEEQTRYYFHSLLSGELRRLFLTTRSAKEQHAFFEKVAEYYLGQNPIAAIRFFLKAKEERRALSVGADFARECFTGGTPERFFPVLSLYTSEQILKNPYLLLMEGMRVLNIDRVAAQTAFMQALIEFRKRRDYLFVMNSFGMMMVVAYQHKGFAALREAGKMLPISAILAKGGSVRTLLTVSHFISLVGQDKLKKAAFYRRVLDRKSIRETIWHFSYLMIRGIYFYRRGELTRSRENLEMLLRHPVMHIDDQWRIIGLVSCCYVSFLQSDLELLQFFISEFSLLAERLRSDFAQGYAQYLRSILYQIQDNRSEALASIEQARGAFRAYGSHVLQMDTECMSFIMSDEATPEMILRARTIVESLKKENTGHGLDELAQATLGILLKRAGMLDEAKTHLMQSASDSEKKGALQSAHALYLQLADLFYLRGEEEKGREYFRKWRVLGSSRGYIYGVPFTHSSLQRVLARAGLRSAHSPYVEEVMRFYNNARKKSRSEQSIAVRFLGPFSLRVGQRELTEKDFKTRKVSGLLKYILVRAQPQSREHLAGIFWPESGRKSAATSLRVALYELRKVLSEAGVGFDSEEALLKESGEGFSSAGVHEICSDTAEMERTYEQLQASRAQERLPLLMKLCDLYQGPFLENNEYDDWVTIQREHYAGIYCEALHSLGEAALRNTYLPAAPYLLRGLEIDPLDEVNYAHLTVLYEQAGQMERAESLRKQFRKRFKSEMGMDARV